MTDTKLTKNQTVVVEALKLAGRPLSAYQILDLDAVREKGLKAPLTIYRALDKLVARGLVHRIESLNAFVVCDHEVHVEPAAFMICDACKLTIEFPATTLRRAISRQVSKFNFQVNTMHFEVTGLCQDCASAA